MSDCLKATALEKLHFAERKVRGKSTAKDKAQHMDRTLPEAQREESLNATA